MKTFISTPPRAIHFTQISIEHAARYFSTILPIYVFLGDRLVA